MLAGARKDYDLPVGRNVHAKPLLHHGSEPLPRRQVSYVALEPGALPFEIGAFPVEQLQPARFRDSVAAAPDYGQAYDDERAEQHHEDAAPAHSYAALRHTRSLALRARELRAISSIVAVTARRVTTRPSARPR